MVIAMTEVGEMFSKLRADSKIEIERNQCIEYWTVQYPEINQTCFYEELIQDLRDETKPLTEIANLYCSEFEFHQITSI